LGCSPGETDVTKFSYGRHFLRRAGAAKPDYFAGMGCRRPPRPAGVVAQPGAWSGKRLRDPAAADHSAEVPKGEGEEGIVVVAAAAHATAAEAVFAATGRDRVFDFFHGMVGLHPGDGLRWEILQSPLLLRHGGAIAVQAGAFSAGSAESFEAGAQLLAGAVQGDTGVVGCQAQRLGGELHGFAVQVHPAQ
jgi:hypothetical protein